MCCSEFVLIDLQQQTRNQFANDRVQIMNVGNQLYLSLSQFDRNSYLMQTELPTMLNACAWYRLSTTTQ